MKKEYTKWNDKKIRINDTVHIPFFHEREIWFCALGLNVGFEQDGRGEDFLRPVLVIRKFNQKVFWAVPLTKTVKDDRPYLYAFSFEETIVSTAILSQLRLIDAKRLTYRVGEINTSDFLKLTEKLKGLFP